MPSPRYRPWLRFLRSECVAALLIGSFVLAPARADEGTPADSTTPPPTHAAFVRAGIDSTAVALFADFPYRRGRPLTMVAGGQPPLAVSWVADAAARELFARGLIVRQTPGAVDSRQEGDWELRYTVSQCQLELSEPHRRVYLGRIWLRRALHLAVSASLWDASSDELLWWKAVDTTFCDYVAKRQLPQLSDQNPAWLAPAPPVMAWERVGAVAPLAALVVVPTIVFLIIR